jgi:hypothetical protein
VGEAMIPTEASKQKMGRGSGIKKDKTEGIAAADHLYDPLSHRSDDRESKGPKKKKGREECDFEDINQYASLGHLFRSLTSLVFSLPLQCYALYLF